MRIRAGQVGDGINRENNEKGSLIGAIKKKIKEEVHIILINGSINKEDITILTYTNVLWVTQLHKKSATSFKVTD